MPRSLAFQLGDDTFDAPIEALDRKKLYGWVEKKAFDRDGNPCYFGTISGDGVHIFGKESFEQGYLDADGHWFDSKSLEAVNDEGTVIEKAPASFSAPIVLDTLVDEDEYLLYVTRSVYQLDASPELLEKVKAAAGIYTFPFNYTASYQPDTAFLIESAGTLFMIIGQHGGFEFVGLAQASTADELADDEESQDDDVESLDFSMF